MASHAAIARLAEVTSELPLVPRMIFGIREFIVEMTKYLTLRPGDVVEIQITGIGTLRNPFIAESAA